MPAYGRFQKIRSWLLLWRLGLPTLRGLIFSNWSAAVEQQIQAFANAVGTQKLLLRSDSLAERGDYLPGGDIVPLERIRDASSPYLGRGRVLFLLEPKSRFDDLYSLGIGFDSQRKTIVEIVGPGFDASDLKRGEVSPHEWMEIRFGTEPGRFEIADHSIGSSDEYRRGWQARLTKVAHLYSGSYPSQVSLDEASLAATEEWLRDLGYTLLLEHRAGYQPIPHGMLERVLVQCQTLPAQLADLRETNGAFVVSVSLIGRDAEPVYWDIVWPSNKFVVGGAVG